MIKKIAILLLGLTLQLTALAQYKTTKIKMAEGLLEEGKYFAALKIYTDISKSEGDNKDIYLKIAELNEQLYNYEEAAKWYYELFEIQNGTYPKSEYKFAELIKMQGKYEIAQKHFESFSKTYQGYDKAVYAKLCKAQIKSCKEAMERLPNAEISVRKIPKNINSAYTDLSPFAYNGKLYYSAIPVDTAITYQEYLDSAPTFQIYMANQIEDEKFDTSVLFIPEVLNEKYQHTSNGAFSADGTMFFFTRCKKNVNGKNICKIYCTVKSDSAWTEPVLLGNEINDRNNGFSSTHPTVLSYKKRGRKGTVVNQLIFASTMPGGEGGYDLWSSDIGNGLEMTKPKNLGKKINTNLNEVTPFFSATENQLFFSSNGMGGLGGLDVFTVPFNNGRFKRVMDLDLPINSSADDWYYNQMSPGNAFLVSNRKGARMYYNGIRLDDIFFVKKETKKYLSLFAYENDSIKTAIKGVVFKVKFANDANAEGTELKENEPIQVIPNKTYEIFAQKNGYINQSTLFSTSYDTKSDTLTWEFTLQKIDTINGFTVNNIYFDVNKAELKPESKQALNKLYKMLIDNPSLYIEIGAHTDLVGTAEYNLELSQKRAQAVVSYLIDKGIGSENLVAKGYGNTQPVTQEAASELNRRIVFKVFNTNLIDKK